MHEKVKIIHSKNCLVEATKKNHMVTSVALGNYSFWLHLNQAFFTVYITFFCYTFKETEQMVTGFVVN